MAHESTKDIQSPRRTGVSESIVSTGDDHSASDRRLPLLRMSLTGVLMGLANLVPGVSGGTMVVVMGLYDEFVESVADVTRLRFRRRGVVFLGILGVAVVLTVGLLAGTMRRLVVDHRGAMYALFIGMTLGGAPLLLKMLNRQLPAGRRFSVRAGIGVVIGLSGMIAIALHDQPPPHRDGSASHRASTAHAVMPAAPNYPRDVAAGALGMSAMVLPGVSGAYMLLIMGRYEALLESVSLAKGYVSGQAVAPSSFLHMLIPFAVGALMSVVLLSNALRWMLHHQRELTLGMLLGLLFGSVMGLWPFDDNSQVHHYAAYTLLAAAGFLATWSLSRITR